MLKHANAKTLNVHLNRYPKILNLLVEDDGIGFAYNAATANGLGLKNIKSRAIPERLGFKYEATLRQCEWLYDHYVDHAVYSMLASEYTDRKLVTSEKKKSIQTDERQ